jgi:transcriptional regulator GlxA family with amidase domain
MQATVSTSPTNLIPWSHGTPIRGTVAAAALSPKIRRVAWHLEQCFLQPITLRQASAVVDIHPDYLSRRFKREIGVGIHEYLLTLRIQRATSLLVNSTKSIKEISSEVGFRDPQVFSKAFKRRMGCPPRTYRDHNFPFSGIPADQCPDTFPANGSNGTPSLN